MRQTEFIRLAQSYYPWIQSLETAAFAIHDNVNQKYDKVLPYGFHLKLTASYVSKYGHEVAEEEADIPILYTAAYLHDCIEDARMSYNDVVKFIRTFEPSAPSLPAEVREALEQQVPEIVYALTNEKGRNRDERANDAYYQGIRSTRFAAFIKMCDRLANIRYSTLFVFTNRMLEVYRREHPLFIQAICEGSVTPIPEAMKLEAMEILNGTYYTVSSPAAR